LTARLAAAAAGVAGTCAAVAAIALGQRAAAQQAPPVVGVWLPVAREVPDPLPLTDAARAAPAATPACPPGMPALLDTHDAVEITQHGDRIRISYAEWGGAARTVHMNPRNGPPTQEPSPLGVSFGRWEARTLAIFTTYIAYRYFDRVGTPQSAAVTVLERYTPNADGSRLEWKVTVTDAATFSAPVVMTGAMTATSAEVAGALTGAEPSSTAAPPSLAAPLVADDCVG
jgi:hypothetical protein